MIKLAPPLETVGLGPPVSILMEDASVVLLEDNSKVQTEG